jgi:hypothetical protein
LSGVKGLTLHLGLYQFREKRERFLPAEIAGFGWNHLRDALLHDVQLRSDGHFLQNDRHLKFAGQVRVVELVRVADALVGHQFKIFPPKQWLWPVVKFVKDIL